MRRVSSTDLGKQHPDRSAGAAPATSRLSAVAAAWVLSLGIDLLLHAGLLAWLYARPTPFLLAPEQAFRRIPIGYLAFLGLTVALDALSERLGVRSAKAGLRLGAASGAVAWGALALGLWSVSTISIPLALGWWLGQTAELALAGAVLGAARGGAPRRRLWGRVVLVVVTCVIVTVVLQSAGWAPPMTRAE